MNEETINNDNPISKEETAIINAAFRLQEIVIAKQNTWDSIRNIELDVAEMKSLSDEAPIFKLFRRASQLDRVIWELGHDYLVSKVAHLAWTLASKADHERRAPPVEAEAA